jgi:hypothetical protein
LYQDGIELEHAAAVLGVEPALLTATGELLPQRQLDRETAGKYFESLQNKFSDMALLRTSCVLECTVFCDMVTAAALRTVGALRLSSGTNFLLPRSGLTLKDRMVPGYAPLEDMSRFDEHVSYDTGDRFSGEHPV